MFALSSSGPLAADVASGLPTVTAFQTRNTGAALTSSLSFDYTNPVPSNLLLVFIRSDLPGGTPTTYAVTYAGQAMTHVDGGNTTSPGAGGGAQGDMFKLEAPPTGTHALTVVPGAARQMHAWAISIRDFASLGTPATANGDNEDASYAVDVPSGENDLVLAGYAWRNSAEDVESPAPAGFTLQTDQGVNGQSSRSAIVYGYGGATETTVSVDLVDPPADTAQRWIAVGVAVAGA